MKVVTTVQEMEALSDTFRRDGLRIGFVPTMGYLHEGHISLVRESAAQCDVTVVSIFVNPVQFGPNEDFSRYPRDIERDCQLCRDAGVAVAFIPPVAEIYAADRSILIEERLLSTGLCGASRPGHFAGVCTVVAKLFNIVNPHVAVFGQKDAQQLAVIRRMVRDLNFRVVVVGAPIVREPDGLAMSSRNVYLSAAERQQALGLSKALALAAEHITRDIRSTVALTATLRKFLQDGYPGILEEYITFVDPATLAPLTDLPPGPVLLALAAKVGRTRLIDNALLDVPTLQP
ncbi:MAG TPA: pantoate--beta-alanine ligase [Verrucomicrobia bacterium]|nr:pantoate--beta-alanine ligase [Verrucomicrobiota bacterium]